ncbi:helix-turn-helix transcriptional regulator [Actinoplanes sp. NPDC049802]|uniref:helix-turn-helix domain-containing protein n=1 Tax=Actinoplanes sp. NPDC049802 TaxID=3154742 RepID=UPI0033EC491B
MPLPDVEILPLTVVAQAFPARPSALPDVRAFLRRQLTGTPVSDEDVRNLCERVADVLLDAAGVSPSIQVSLRVFPSGAEIDVLSSSSAPAAPAVEKAPEQPARGTRVAVPAPPSFAAWFAGRLRAEGLTLEAAARRLEVSAKTVSRWVSGATEPRLRDFHRIRSTFGEPPL